MTGDHFGHILKDTKSTKEGTELYLKLVETTETAYNKYVEAVYAWRQDEHEKATQIRDEIIKLERDADKVKDIFFESIFRKKVYLPGIAEERHIMMLNADRLIAQIERAVRVLCLKRIDFTYFPPELDLILEKTKDVLNCYVKANLYFFTDFDKSAEFTRKIEVLRDEVRDYFFIVLGRVINDEYPRGTRRLLNVTTEISLQAEEATDYLKVLIAKHS